MPLLKLKDHQKLVKKLGAKEAAKHYAEALRNKQLKADDFSLRDVFESFVVDKNSGDPMGNYILGKADGGMLSEETIYESNASVVSTDGFADLNGQIIYSKIQERFQAAEYNLGNLPEKIPAISKDGDVIPGVSNFGPAPVVPENSPLPQVGPVRNKVKTAALEKRGLELFCTWEEMRFDRTYEVMNRCSQLGDSLALAKELQFCRVLADTVLGQPYRYRWNDATPVSPYRTSISAPLNWINDITSSGALTDHTSVNALYKLLAKIADPLTGYPMASPPSPYVLICGTDLAFPAERIRNSYQLRTGSDPMLITDGGTNGSLPVPFEVKVSKYLHYVLSEDSQATTKWFFGNPKEAIKETEGLPFTVENALPLSGRMFDNHLVFGIRALMMQVYSWYEPRYMGRSAV